MTSTLRSSEVIAAGRRKVEQDYIAAVTTNAYEYACGSVKATSEYIFPNQKEDANIIVDLFYRTTVTIIGIVKRTKVGMDGLMIEIAKLMTTHIDDAFIVPLENVRIITGMSNLSWETDMKDKTPECFRKKIFHHGQLQNSDLQNLRNGLIIIDEIDTGNKQRQKLDKVLQDARILDINYLCANNIRLVIVSATMLKELYELYRWGPEHYRIHFMTIPPSYISHKDFLDRGIIQEFYPLKTSDACKKWIQEDILNHYGDDYRINLVRLKGTHRDILKNMCIAMNVVFRDHTSDDRITKEEEEAIFTRPLSQHVVLAVKGFFRRANLIPNKYKLRIGATHEEYTNKVDNNVQIQGFPGRMTGYWRHIIEAGHKIGPYRTSVKAIQEYEENYRDPFGAHSYHSSGFTKTERGRSHINPTLLNPENIRHLIAGPMPQIHTSNELYRIFDSEMIAKAYATTIGYLEERSWPSFTHHEDGRLMVSLRDTATVRTLTEVIDYIPNSFGDSSGGTGGRVCYPCYVDIVNSATLRFVIPIRSNVDPIKVRNADVIHKPLNINNL